MVYKAKELIKLEGYEENVKGTVEYWVPLKCSFDMYTVSHYIK